MKSPKHNDAKRLAWECCVDDRSGSRRLETVAVLLPTHFGRRNGGFIMIVILLWFFVLAVFVFVVAFMLAA